MKNEFTIFYTDDDQDDLDYFREIIEMIDESFILVTQQSGQQLLNTLLNPPPTPHIIFLDINMPGMSGFDILKKVRELKNHNSLPIVMFSTTNDRKAVLKSMELGANYYVPKSGVFENLKKSIEHALKINWGTFIPTEQNFVYNFR